MSAQAQAHGAHPAVLEDVPAARVRDLLGGSRRQREAALLATGLAGVVDELPEGEDTPVGAGGVPLGAAERHGLATARRIVAGSTDADVAVETAPTPPVVDDDAAVPGLPLLLDPVAMSPLLGRALPGVPDPDVRVRAVRYQPGSSAVVQYAVATGSRWLTAVAFVSSTGKPRRQSTGRRAGRAASYVAGRTPVETPVHFLEEAGALVCWLPVDLGLPMVGLRTKKLNRRLSEVDLPPVLADKPRLLRYWPRRRAVIRFGPYVLKTYRRRSDYEQAERGLRGGAALRSVSTPSHLGSLPGRRTTIQRRVSGHPSSLSPAGCAPAGRLLADLHREEAPVLDHLSATDVLAKAASRGAHLGLLVPDLAPRFDALTARMAERLPSGGPGVTSHGNFHAGQLLTSAHGVVLLDLDRLCIAAPSYDLGCFVAQYALGRPGDADLLATVESSLVEGYGHRPDDLGWYLAAALLRRALVPFRRQLPDWPAATEHLLTLAEAAAR